MHSLQPKTTYNIRTILLAVPEAIAEADFTDAMNEMLNGAMCQANGDGAFDDWALGPIVHMHTTDDQPEEGETFPMSARYGENTTLGPCDERQTPQSESTLPTAATQSTPVKPAKPGRPRVVSNGNDPKGTHCIGREKEDGGLAMEYWNRDLLSWVDWKPVQPGQPGPSLYVTKVAARKRLNLLQELQACSLLTPPSEAALLSATNDSLQSLVTIEERRRRKIAALKDLCLETVRRLRMTRTVDPQQLSEVLRDFTRAAVLDGGRGIRLDINGIYGLDRQTIQAEVARILQIEQGLCVTFDGGTCWIVAPQAWQLE